MINDGLVHLAKTFTFKTGNATFVPQFFAGCTEDEIRHTGFTPMVAEMAANAVSSAWVREVIVLFGNPRHRTLMHAMEQIVAPRCGAVAVLAMSDCMCAAFRWITAKTNCYGLEPRLWALRRPRCADMFGENGDEMLVKQARWIDPNVFTFHDAATQWPGRIMQLCVHEEDGVHAIHQALNLFAGQDSESIVPGAAIVDIAGPFKTFETNLSSFEQLPFASSPSLAMLEGIWEGQ